VLFLGSSCAPPLALFVMSVMLTEPIVIENVRPVEGSPGCVVLDAQMYVFSRTGPHWPLSILQHRRDQVRRRRPLLRLGARLYFSLLAAALSNRTQIARPVPGNLRPDRTGPSGDGTGPTDDYNDIVRNFTVCGDFVRVCGFLPHPHLRLSRLPFSCSLPEGRFPERTVLQNLGTVRPC